MYSKLLRLGLIMTAVNLVACEDSVPVAPPSNEGIAVEPNAAPVIVTTTAIGPFPGSGSAISGEATLTRSKNGVRVDQDIEGLTPSDAYSVWWVIFDNPQGCDGNCDASDLSRRQAQGSLVNGGGFVADGTTRSYSSHLTRHDVEGKQVQLGDPSGVDNPYRAEIHLVLRAHGPAEMNPANLAVQTSTFNGFCNLPPDPPGVCQNVSAAVFTAPDAPGQGS